MAAVEYRLLGPVEALVDGRPVDLGGPRQRGVLVTLLTEANSVVPASRLVDAVWGDEPPATAANLVQRAVSQLRKGLGRDAIKTRGTGYVATVEAGALDLEVFERLAREGSAALTSGDWPAAAASLHEALGLWRGPALADLSDQDFLRLEAARLDELRLLALERRIEAELACGRHADVLAEAGALTQSHPLRERGWALLMTALYRSGRQGDALAAYRTARAALVEELGIEPGPSLKYLEDAILRQDPALSGEEAAPAAQPPARIALRSVLAGPLEAAHTGALAELGRTLASHPPRELVVATTVSRADELAQASALVHEQRARLLDQGVQARAAAFVSLTPGADLARLAREHDVDLLLVDAPAGLLEDARLVTVLDQAPCDVAVLVAGGLRPGPVMVPFGGTIHDWAAIELGAWLAGNLDRPLQIAGASDGAGGRDASRLLASASLAVQHALGVPAEPLLVEPEAAALVEAAEGAGIVVVGLTERWRREGLGRARTALATAGSAPVLLVRRGVRPGGLAPPDGDTRFTWTIAPSR